MYVWIAVQRELYESAQVRVVQVLRATQRRRRPLLCYDSNFLGLWSFNDRGCDNFQRLVLHLFRCLRALGARLGGEERLGGRRRRLVRGLLDDLEGLSGDLSDPAALRGLPGVLRAGAAVADGGVGVAGGGAAHPVGPHVGRGLQQQVAQLGRLGLQREGLLGAAGGGLGLAQQELQLGQRVQEARLARRLQHPLRGELQRQQVLAAVQRLQHQALPHLLLRDRHPIRTGLSVSLQVLVVAGRQLLVVLG
mmetsp:Transcript_22574/g.30918  ORF Transcript_22574/g.30918 Transcript_22574/m.30918 type:complete len:250 (-) Transcript_22574:739-1488(-)